MNRQFSLKLIFLVTSIVQALVAGEDTFYIVTSLSSTCPEKVNGETCFTLPQYATQVDPYASSRSNTTLILESGQHEIFLSDFLSLFHGDVGNFTMVSTNAHVLIKVVYPSHYLPYHSTHVYYMRGISFIISEYDYMVTLQIGYVQNVIIDDCTFLGIKLYIKSVNTVVISRSCFSNGNITRLNNYFTTSSTESITINETYFITNTSATSKYYYSGQSAVYIGGNRRSVVISGTTFVNCTSGALYISRSYYHSGGSVVLISNIFFNNQNIGGYYSALFTRKHANISIVNTTFVYNSANYSSCGAFHIVDSSVYIVDSVFYYNWARDDGGAGCITNGNLSISNSNFIQNFAMGVGGALTSDNSSVTITKSVFRDNMAVYSGGALSTYVLSSDYIITESSFIGNHAGGDGGAILIGRRESHLRVEDSTFSDNRANERGGAIAIFGSTMIMIATNVYDNEAALGKSISSCSSEVATSLLQGQRDHRYSFCTNYDSSVHHYDLTLTNEHSLPSNVNLGITRVCFTSTSNGIRGKLQMAAAVSYTALTVSITLVIAVLLYVVITKAVPQIRRQQNGTENEVEIQDEPEPEPEYEEANVHANVDHIEMVPNVVYGSHGAAN